MMNALQSGCLPRLDMLTINIEPEGQVDISDKERDETAEMSEELSEVCYNRYIHLITYEEMEDEDKGNKDQDYNSLVLCCSFYFMLVMHHCHLDNH